MSDTVERAVYFGVLLLTMIACLIISSINHAEIQTQLAAYQDSVTALNYRQHELHVSTLDMLGIKPQSSMVDTTGLRHFDLATDDYYLYRNQKSGKLREVKCQNVIE